MKVTKKKPEKFNPFPEVAVVHRYANSLSCDSVKWFDDADAEEKRIHQRKNTILRGADTIYQNLWNEIISQVEYIAEKGREILTNGSPLDRIVTVSYRTGSRECHLKLDQKREKITATGGGVDVTFDLDIGDDGLICLSRGGKIEQLSKAAEAILRPLLFPESNKDTVR